MTYSYSNRCGTVKGVGNFWSLLFLWKASVYKTVWVDLCIFLFIYYSLGLAYNFLLEGRAKVIFEQVCYYCASQMSFIPLSFVLGFYISNIISRWETQFKHLPVSDYVAIIVSTNIKGTDDQSRLMRRTIMRYLNASFIMLMMVICTPVRKRFPSFDHLVVAGMLFETEKKILESIHHKLPTYNIYWVPMIWAINIVCKARQQNKITGDENVIEIIRKICAFRSDCGKLLTYDWMSIPLVYTQVVTLAVYSFFLAAVFGRQVLEHNKEHHHQPIDIYFPIFTILQFLFYMGWLKVAETLINPFGEDDDDFEINWTIDRNIQLGYAIVDEVHLHVPDMVKDHFWDKVIPENLPYNCEAENKHDQAPLVLDPHLPIHDSISKKLAAEGRRSSLIDDKSRRLGYVFPVYENVEKYWQGVFSNVFSRNIIGKSFLNDYYVKNKEAKDNKRNINERQFNALILESNPDLKDVVVNEEKK